MYLPQRLNWTLLSINTLLILGIYSAPTFESSGLIDNSRPITYQEYESGSHGASRRSIDALFRRATIDDWDVYKNWKAYIVKHPKSAKGPQEMPADTPEGHWTRWTRLFHKNRYTYPHIENNVKTERSITLGEKIGSGGFGTVLQGTLMIPGKSEVDVAVKSTLKDKGGLINGAIMQATISSPNIMPWIDYFYLKELETAYLVMPRANEGSLDTHLPRLLKEGQSSINALFKQILAGVKVMHAATDAHPDGLIHCDIKPGNILMDGGIPKIIDFDQVTSAQPSVKYNVGTLGFRAPEIMLLKPFTKSSDIFSMGMLWLVMSNKELWSISARVSLWTKLVSPNRDGSEESLAPLRVKSLLVANFDGKMSTGMMDLASEVLCGAEHRIDAEMFYSRLEALEDLD